METVSTIEYKIEQLRVWFLKKKGLVVAFSGGVDSTLALFLANYFLGKDNAIGVISNSYSLKQHDFKSAIDFCQEFSISYVVIHTNEIEDFKYFQNPENRCFYCKEHLYKATKDICNTYQGFTIINGTNYDDLQDYRPGLEAAVLFEIESPFVDCKISKDDIRNIANFFKLPNWNKPASPCLSSRIPYNQIITVEKLQQIEIAEHILEFYGFKQARVRHHGEYCTIEVPKNELGELQSKQSIIYEELSNIGFKSVIIDEEGFVSGKLNREILIYSTNTNK